MLLTRSRSIEIDAKNALGFTPLMKAALQGRTRCAKLLLFAGKKTPRQRASSLTLYYKSFS